MTRCTDTRDFFEDPPKTSAERQKAYTARQRAMGRVQRSMWATPAEWAKIRDFLEQEREK